MSVAPRGRRLGPCLVSFTNDVIGPQALNCSMIPMSNAGARVPWWFDIPSIHSPPFPISSSAAAPSGSDSDEDETSINEKKKDKREDKKEMVNKSEKGVKFKNDIVDVEISVPTRSALQKCFSFLNGIFPPLYRF